MPQTVGTTASIDFAPNRYLGAEPYTSRDVGNTSYYAHCWTIRRSAANSLSPGYVRRSSFTTIDHPIEDSPNMATLLKITLDHSSLDALYVFQNWARRCATPSSIAAGSLDRYT